MKAFAFLLKSAFRLAAVSALLLLPASFSQAAPAPRTHSPEPPAVIVKIGTPSLEEYRHGDPAGRVQLVCTVTAPKPKHHA